VARDKLEVGDIAVGADRGLEDDSAGDARLAGQGRVDRLDPVEDGGVGEP